MTKNPELLEFIFILNLSGIYWNSKNLIMYISVRCDSESDSGKKLYFTFAIQIYAVEGEMMTLIEDRKKADCKTLGKVECLHEKSLLFITCMVIEFETERESPSNKVCWRTPGCFLCNIKFRHVRISHKVWEVTRKTGPFHARKQIRWKRESK